LNFRALVVVGDGSGLAGFGIGKATEVPEAIRKATEKAKKSMLKIPMTGTTIPHPVEAKFGSTRVILKPACPGHGLVLGGTMRAFFEVAGVRDVTGKCLGSTNAVNVIQATAKAVGKLKIPREQTNETASA